MVQEQLYPHGQLREEDDSPPPIRNITNRTLTMISVAHRGYVNKATVVNSDNFESVIGMSSHRGSVALEAMFGTFNPDRVLFRRVIAQDAAAFTADTAGINVTAAPSADETLVIRIVGIETVPVTYNVNVPLVALGSTIDSVADEIKNAINGTAGLPVTAELDPNDSSRVLLTSTTLGSDGNGITYQVILTGMTTVATPATATPLTGGTDGPTTASVVIPTATPLTDNWTLVYNFTGACGNEASANVYHNPSSPGMFSLDIIDEFDGNKVKSYPNLNPVKAAFLNDGSSFGYKYIGFNHPLVSLYYSGNLDDIKAPATLPAAPPAAPTVQYALTGGSNGSAVTVADYLRTIDASGEDETTLIMCPDMLTPTEKAQINARLRAQAINATELSGLRQAVCQMPVGTGDYATDLDADLAANNESEGFVVSVCSMHTGVWRPELPPDSYSGDIFVAAAMATKRLHVSLADRKAVAPISGVVSTTVSGVDPSRNIDMLNKIQTTGHEAVVFDPGTRVYQFLTGRAMASNQDKQMSRAQNRQMQNQIRTDLWYMIQAYKSGPIAGMLSSLKQQVDNYFQFRRDNLKDIQNYKATVGDKSNNPDARVVDGWARIDAYWAPKLIADKIEGVIHTYVETGL